MDQECNDRFIGGFEVDKDVMDKLGKEIADEIDKEILNELIDLFYMDNPMTTPDFAETFDVYKKSLENDDSGDPTK